MRRDSNVAPRLASCGRYTCAIAALFACIFVAVLAACVGLSRLLSQYGSAADSLAAAEQALRFNTADPEAHYAQAVELAKIGSNDEAVAEFEHAVSLRPMDYFFWQELARARDENGNDERAIAALHRAISLAPYYSQPHWQLGNVLLRGNQLDAAFQELRYAVASDPALFPALTDLAWSVYEGDARSVLAATQPQTNEERISLAHFFVNHNWIEAGLSLVQSTDITTEDRCALVAALIAGRRFREAHELWIVNVPSNAGAIPVFDGGFEGFVRSDEQGFGWKSIPATQTVHIALDTERSHSGKQSLRLEYSGNSDSGLPIITQLVLVAPTTHYLLTFAVRTQDLVSGGLPIVTVIDATEHRVLAQSRSLSPGTTDWRELSIDFETTRTTAVTIGVQRQACSSQPCPIFGRAWFDDVSIQLLRR